VRSVGWSLTRSTHMTIKTSKRRPLCFTLERQGQTKHKKTIHTPTLRYTSGLFRWGFYIKILHSHPISPMHATCPVRFLLSMTIIMYYVCHCNKHFAPNCSSAVLHRPRKLKVNLSLGKLKMRYGGLEV
jgi:hypothetical protein